LDRSKRPSIGPPDEATEKLLADVVHPATLNQVAAFWDAGLRQRTLTLPVMVAFVLSLIWRQMGSVAEAVRALHREGMLWTAPLKPRQQSVSQRLRELPAHLFENVLLEVLPKMQERWQQRKRRLPPVLEWVGQRFSSVLAADGSTLDALMRKVGLLREGEGPVLGGRMAALLDVVSQLPRRIWYEENSQAHDQSFWERVIDALPKGCLLLFDLGFVNHPVFDRLTDLGVWFVTRAKANHAVKPIRVLARRQNLLDQVVLLGSRQKRCAHEMRLVEVSYKGQCYRYLTNVLDPEMLPAEYVVALYWQRWRIEDAFKAVKRLLGLAYFFAGSLNTVQLQVWATWLLYACLVDLTDAVAERLKVAYQDVSMEMTYRGLYHYTQAHHRGETNDPVAYLAANAKDLGILKRKRRPSPAELLHLTVAQIA